MKPRKESKFFIFILLCMTLLSSCSGGRILVVEDPYFDSFATHSVKFYEIKKKLVFLRAGYRTDFINPIETEDSIQGINQVLAGGAYDGLISFYMSYHQLEIPLGIRTALIGGSQEINYPGAIQIISSGSVALHKAGAELYTLWEEQGTVPLTIFQGNPDTGPEERAAFRRGWGDENSPVLEENWIDLERNGENSEKRLEDFFRKYDLKSGGYIIFAYCPSVYRDLLRVLPEDRVLPIILAAPENPVLPDETIALISDNYLGLLRAAAESLKESSPGDLVRVEKEFIRK